jgi:hypothetical protein
MMIMATRRVSQVLLGHSGWAKSRPQHEDMQRRHFLRAARRQQYTGGSGRVSEVGTNRNRMKKQHWFRSSAPEEATPEETATEGTAPGRTGPLWVAFEIVACPW